MGKPKTKICCIENANAKQWNINNQWENYTICI